MKKQVVVAGLLTLLGMAALLVYAAPGITISYQTTTAAQDTYVQATIIPEANTELCAKFGLGASCTGSQLTTAGCVASPISSITKSNLVFQNCTPYTPDNTGEINLAADAFAQAMVAKVANDKSADITASCTAFKAASGATQNSVCSTLGRPNGCSVC